MFCLFYSSSFWFSRCCCCCYCSYFFFVSVSVLSVRETNDVDTLGSTMKTLWFQLIESDTREIHMQDIPRFTDEDGCALNDHSIRILVRWWMSHSRRCHLISRRLDRSRSLVSTSFAADNRRYDGQPKLARPVSLLSFSLFFFRLYYFFSGVSHQLHSFLVRSSWFFSWCSVGMDLLAGISQIIGPRGYRRRYIDLSRLVDLEPLRTLFFRFSFVSSPTVSNVSLCSTPI